MFIWVPISSFRNILKRGQWPVLKATLSITPFRRQIQMLRKKSAFALLSPFHSGIAAGGHRMHFKSYPASFMEASVGKAKLRLKLNKHQNVGWWWYFMVASEKNTVGRDPLWTGFHMVCYVQRSGSNWRRRIFWRVASSQQKRRIPALHPVKRTQIQLVSLFRVVFWYVERGKILNILHLKMYYFLKF